MEYEDEPLTPKEVFNLLTRPIDVKFILYSDLKRLPKDGEYYLCLYRENPKLGHWIVINRINNTIYYFDPLGGAVHGEPDGILDDYDDIDESINQNLNQTFQLSDLLKKNKNLKIEYNDYPFMGNHEDTCGRWAALYMNLGLPIEDFKKIIKPFMKNKQFILKITNAPIKYDTY